MTEDQLDTSHATMDDLYSNMDSYFHSYYGCCPDKDSIQSLHSLDSLDNTFGMFNQSILHLINGIEVMLEKKDMEEKAASLPGGGGDSWNIDLLDLVLLHLLPMVDTSMLAIDQLGTHIGDGMLEEKVKCKKTPVLGATPRGYKEALKLRLTQALNNSSHSLEIASSSLERSGETVKKNGHKAFELVKDMPTFDYSDVVYQSSEVV
jgi:hypothetical protein